MEKLITKENVFDFAFTNEAKLVMPIKGIVLEFNGLSNATLYDERPELDFLANDGILFVQPYTDPWAWMNDQAVKYVDEIIDVLIYKYDLDKNIPIISTGGSMGGLSAIVYANYAKITPKAVCVNCPVCDLPYHFTERRDLPRTLYSAYYNDNCTMKEALIKRSPLHLAEKLPKIPYHIFHCDKDSQVNIDKHTKMFLQELKNNGHNFTFDVCENHDHCDLTDELWNKYFNFVKSEINS